jgi:hypothetical protein
MKHFRTVIVAITVLFTLAAESATNHDNFLGVGANVDTYEEDLPARLDIEDDYRFAPTIGWKHTIMWDNFGFRTGIFAEWKKLAIEDKAAGQDDIDLTAYYVAIPLNAQFSLMKALSIFGGITPRVLVSKSCADCGSFDDDEEMVYNSYNFGVAWAFSQKFSLEVNFNRGAGDAFKDLGFNTTQVLIYWKI